MLPTWPLFLYAQGVLYGISILFVYMIIEVKVQKTQLTLRANYVANWKMKEMHPSNKK